jgi:uncharacterized protein with ATP-grasp and redox domains
MRTYLDCLPCFMNQIVRVGRMLELSEADCLELLKEFAAQFDRIELADPPPKTSIALYRMIARRIGREDPFAEFKREHTARALALYPRLKEQVAAADDPLSLALRLAVAGNVIDFGVASEFDLEAEIERVVDHGAFGRWQEEALCRRLKAVDWLLYLGDNAGETVFDRIFIETLVEKHVVKVKFVVRGGPIINDATLADARAAGLESCAELISSGCPAPGTVLELCSPDFRELFAAAPLILSKGQGNFETLSETPAPLFFLLKAKCPVVAGHLQANLGELLLVARQ